MNVRVTLLALSLLVFSAAKAEHESQIVNVQTSTSDKVLKSLYKTIQNHKWLAGFFAVVPLTTSHRFPVTHTLSYAYGAKALLEEFAKQLGYEFEDDDCDRNEGGKTRLFTLLKFSLLYAIESWYLGYGVRYGDERLLI